MPSTWIRENEIPHSTKREIRLFRKKWRANAGRKFEGGVTWLVFLAARIEHLSHVDGFARDENECLTEKQGQKLAQYERWARRIVERNGFEFIQAGLDAASVGVKFPDGQTGYLY